MYPFYLDIRSSREVMAGVRTSSTSYLPGNTILDYGEWYHVAYTFRNGTRVIYINGVEDNSDSPTGTLNIREESTNVGKTPDADEYFVGIMDDVRIYNRTLTTPEIQALLQARQYHRADTDRDGCIVMQELSDFIDRWLQNSAEYPMPEMMGAVGLWKSGTGCIN